MMTFSSPVDLLRLPYTDTAQPVITKLAHGLFSDTQPVTITLMQPDDINPPLADLCSAEDVRLEGIIEQAGMFLVALKTDYGYSIVFVVPDEDWLSSELRQCIEENLYH